MRMVLLRSLLTSLWSHVRPDSDWHQYLRPPCRTREVKIRSKGKVATQPFRMKPMTPWWLSFVTQVQSLSAAMLTQSREQWWPWSFQAGTTNHQTQPFAWDYSPDRHESLCKRGSKILQKELQLPLIRSKELKQGGYLPVENNSDLAWTDVPFEEKTESSWLISNLMTGENCLLQRLISYVLAGIDSPMPSSLMSPKEEAHYWGW